MHILKFQSLSIFITICACLKMVDEEIGDVYIDGLDEKRISRVDKDTTTYIYRYYVGEQLELICQPRTKATWLWQGDTLQDYTPNETCIRANLTRWDNDKDVVCVHRKSNGIVTIRVRLSLADTGVLTYFYFKGFDRKRLQFINVTYFTYNFHENELLDIHCRLAAAGYGDTKWIYSATEALPRHHKTILTKDNDGKNISCTMYNLYDRITGQKHFSFKLDMNRTTLSTTSVQDWTEETTMASQFTSQPDGNNNIYYGVGGAVCFILLIITVWAIIIHIKRDMKVKKNSSNVTYENMSNDPQSQFPPNIENYYETLSTTEMENHGTPQTDFYAQPVPKSKRIDLMYSKIVPKDQRKSVKPQKTEQTYSEVQAKESQADESTYSEVRQEGYVNLKGYANEHIFNPRGAYANSPDIEYVEPAYCEFSSFK